MTGRDLSTAFRNVIEARDSGDSWLVFATITHVDLPDTIRVVTEEDGNVSFKNGEIVNYIRDSNLFLGCPFQLELLTDNERMPVGRISIPDVERQVGVRVLPLVESPKLMLELVRMSQFATTVGANNARSPSEAIVVQWMADYLYLKNVKGDMLFVNADIQTFDYSSEPWPKTRSTPDILPAMRFL